MTLERLRIFVAVAERDHVTAAARALNLTASGALAERYLGDAPQGVYLIRPDQHVAARWPSFDPAAVAAALSRATGQPEEA